MKWALARGILCVLILFSMYIFISYISTQTHIYIYIVYILSSSMVTFPFISNLVAGPQNWVTGRHEEPGHGIQSPGHPDLHEEAQMGRW
jgi:hypothetical protein